MWSFSTRRIITIDVYKRQAADALVEVAGRVEPDPELTARYEARYQQFRSIYPALRQVFPQLL